MASYELWLTDDAGRRLRAIRGESFFSYTRAVNGLGTFSCGFPMELIADLNPYFRPDWRMEVWRSPLEGIPMRREDVYLLRQSHIYTRDDNVQMIQYYGRNGMDLLKRRVVAQRSGTIWAQKTDYLDDMIKAYVSEQMLYGSALDQNGTADNTRAWPQYEFLVQADASLGPSVTRNVSGRNVYDVCRELALASQQLNEDDENSRRIYFDVLPVDVSGATTNHSPLGWLLATFADQRGSDRRGGLEFSQENGNMRLTSLNTDHMDEVTSVWVSGNGQGLSQLITRVQALVRMSASRWNRAEAWKSASSEATSTALNYPGYAELRKGRPKEKLTTTLLNVPGGPDTPRSLYGVDWDFGDLVRVSYAERLFDMEITLVYVSVNDQGEEQITGRNELQ